MEEKEETNSLVLCIYLLKVLNMKYTKYGAYKLYSTN